MGLTNNTGKLSNTLTSNGTQITLGGSTVTDGNLLNIIGNQSSVNVGIIFNNTNGTYPRIYGLQNVNNNLTIYDYTANASRLSITSAGNVGIGVTSPSLLLEVNGGGRFTSNLAVGAGLPNATYPLNTSSGAGTQILSNSTRTGGGGWILQSSGVDSVYLGTANWVGVSGYGSGTTDIALAAQQSTAGIVFATGPSVIERMKITSSGDMVMASGGQIQTTGGYYRLRKADASTTGLIIQKATWTGSGTDYSMSFAAETGYGMSFFTNGTGTERLRLYYDGYISMNSVVFGTTTAGTTRTLYIGDANYIIGGISSIRASKKNIVNVSNVDWIYQLNPVTFNYRKKDEEGNYIEETYEDLNYGLIAEDTAPIADFLINYNDKEDGTKEMIGIEYPRLIIPLLKAIQELKAEIDELKNR